MNNLKWMGHTQTIIEMQKKQIEDLSYCDVRLSCGGKLFSAHKIILSSCSDFFREIFKNAPDISDSIVILPDIKDFILENIISFIYTGEVSLSSASISDFLESINILGIKSAISFECHLKKDFQKAIVQNNPANTTLTAISMEVDDENDEILETKPNKDGYIEEEIDTVDCNQAETEQVSTTTSVTQFETGSPQKIQFLEVYNHSNKINQYTIEQLESETAGESTEDETGAADDYILTEHADNTYTLSDSKHIPGGGEIKQIVFESTPKIRRKNSNVRSIKQEIADSNLMRNESFSKAMHDVLNQGLSLQKAAEKYGVSKTVLWRRVRKNPNYNKVFRENPIIEAAIVKLEKGDSLKSVSESLSIPISTLHRHKIRLVAEGRLPDHYQVKRRTMESKKTLQEKLIKAVEACNNGMSQNHAASVFDVPKSTLWRYMKKVATKDFKTDDKDLSDNKEMHIEEVGLSENAVEGEDMCDDTANEIETVNIDPGQTELVEEF